MKATEPFTDLKTRLVLVACLVLLGGCSPSDPKLSFVGIDAPGVIQMIDHADSAEKKEIALSHLESNRRAGFDWTYFWRGLGQLQRLEKFDRGSQTRIFKLSENSCTPEAFGFFAEVVLKAEHGFGFVFGPTRSCAQPIPVELFSKYIGYFRAQKADENTFAQLMITEYIQIKETDRTKILRFLTTNEWSNVIHGLLQKGDATSAAQLVQMQQDQFGGVKFVDDMIVDWLIKPAALQDILENNNVIDVAHILITDPQLRWMNGKVKPDQWKAVLRALRDKFSVEAARLESNPELLDQLLNSLGLLEALPLRAENAPVFSDQLIWFEDLLRSLEDGVRRSALATSALRFSTQDPLALWLKFRIARAFEDSDRRALDGMSGSNPLSEALIWRLRMHSSQTDFSFAKFASSYCSWLEANGLPARAVDGGKLRTVDLQQPGCISLTGNRKPEDTVTLEAAGPLVMAFDNVLITNGWNVNIKASRFDGSFIDLSTALKHPDLPMEATPVEDNAVVVPLLLGIRVRDNSFDQGSGIYYFVYHYTWRSPKPGRASEMQAADGFNGANLKIEVEDLAGTFPPRSISRGGRGQKGAPQRAGGLGDTSEVNWGVFTNELSQFKPAVTEDQKLSRPVAFPTPTFRLLDQLFKLGDVTASGAIELLVDPQLLWGALNLDQHRKASLVCPAGPGDRACWAAVVNRAAGDLWSEYSKVCPANARGEHECPIYSLDHTLPRLSSIRFEEYQAPIGPINPNGNFGANGTVTIQDLK